MLNAFPHLLDFALVAPLILRVAVGFVFLTTGTQLLKRQEKSPATTAVLSISILGGILLIIGMWTQVAAIVLLLTLVGMKLSRQLGLIPHSTLPYSKELSLLLAASLVALVFLGAGLFAIDLPL